MKTLYLMLGYPGSGKTTIARIIHSLTDAENIWADHERHRMFGNPTHTHQESLSLYKHLNQYTEKLLAAGKSVIFDTNFNFYEDRQKLRELAAKQGAETLVIWVNTPKELARERATHGAIVQDTRVWGNMSEETFDRIANNLERPRSDETVIEIDGSRVSEKDIASKLAKTTV